MSIEEYYNGAAMRLITLRSVSVENCGFERYSDESYAELKRWALILSEELQLQRSKRTSENFLTVLDFYLNQAPFGFSIYCENAIYFDSPAPEDIDQYNRNKIKKAADAL